MLWYRLLCLVLTAAGVGAVVVLFGWFATWDAGDIVAASAVAVGVAALWTAFLTDWWRTRRARRRLRRLGHFLAQPGATARFPHRVLERALLRRRVRGRGIMPLIRSAVADAPRCIVLRGSPRTAMPIPDGSDVSFEPIGLDTDRTRCEELFLVAAPQVERKKLRTTRGRMRNMDPRLVPLAWALVPIAIAWLIGGVVMADKLDLAGGAPAGWGSAILLIVWLAPAVVVIWLVGKAAHCGRWWVAPQTFIVDRSAKTGRHEVLRRADSRLWIDQNSWSAWVVGPDGRIHWRGLRRIDVTLMLFGWLSSADPPPVDHAELPT